MTKESQESVATQKAEWEKPVIVEIKAGTAEAGGSTIPDGPGASMRS